MTAPLEVDVTGWLIARLQAVLGDAVRVGSRTPADEAGSLSWLPFVRVSRQGGGDDGFILDQATMVIHCFGANLAGANGLAYSVMTQIRALRGVVADGAVVSLVRKLGGPFWIADDNPGVEHVALNVQLHIKTAAR